MKISFRNYARVPGFSEDYFKVRSFIVKLADDYYTFARWDHTVIHSDSNALSRIGLWELGDEVVGMAIFDMQPGRAYCFTMRGYEYLWGEILSYARQSLNQAGTSEVLIADTDAMFQEIAARDGYTATEQKASVASLAVHNADLTYRLPDGFTVTSMKETFDLERFAKVLHVVLNHRFGSEEFVFTPERERTYRQLLLRPNVDLSLIIAVVAPNGDFASLCSLMYEPKQQTAMAVTVGTDPAYRGLGLAKAGMREGIARCAAAGAARILASSLQPFYYSIGFRPYSNYSWWRVQG